MRHPHTHPRWPWKTFTLVATGTTVITVVAAPATRAAAHAGAHVPAHAAVSSAAHAAVHGSAVTGWLRRHAAPLAGIDPAAPLTDLAALRPMLGDASVVGLGESTHGAAEETRLKHRTLRYLVEELGFRSIAWEEDWTVGLEVDDYLRTGKGDVNTLVRKMARTWRTREVADVLGWLRAYNATHDEQVRFVGVECFATGPRAYDAVTRYVAETAPGRKAELARHMRKIRPDTADMGAYVQWYYGVKDKKPYIRHARQAYELVRKVPHDDGDRAYELALQHARQIVSFYEYFDQKNVYQYRDARAAENLRWWRDRTGDRIAYWAASPHTAKAAGVTVHAPGGPPLRFDGAGSLLRRWYGRKYRSIGFTFTRGTLAGADGRPARVPAPPRDWADAPFGAVRHAQYAVDLQASRAPDAVRAWLRTPAKMRCVAAYDPAEPEGHYMSGSSPAGWFDVIVHRQEISPPHPIA
ncbi:erythromycin esterase family protein [Nonomuraea diastatica]|uniref:Erythromycin esterase family protein n=1 Tax=Nonomuraea diastatica TaxID=1848329 RepID=A0A4R4X2Q5_9ACTN|nr:erythromycin esterase family protein [Nonomuraea diastatica]TDD24445.1 erythromycin esterase family protein [Nonomuraea diastatica]